MSNGKTFVLADLDSPMSIQEVQNIYKRLHLPDYITLYELPLREVTHSVLDDILTDNMITDPDEREQYHRQFIRSGCDYYSIVRDMNLDDTRKYKNKYTGRQIHFISMIKDIQLPWSDIAKKYDIKDPAYPDRSNMYDQYEDDMTEEDFCIWPKELWVYYKVNNELNDDLSLDIVRLYNKYNNMSLEQLEDDGY